MNEERKVKYGFLHCHTDESNRDSVMTVETLVKRAAELGAPAVALTDHGVMTGYLRFAEECAKYDINAIFGVEAYVQEDAKPGEGTEEKRMHLILMAKDYEYGFKALIKAVSESNERMDSQGFARMNKDILRKYFGPGAPGHGHVIATSACVSGVLASLYSMNDEIAKKVEKLKTSQSGLETPTSPGYLHNRTRLDWIEKTLQESAKRITAYKKQSGKPTAALEKKIYAAAEGSAKRAAAQAAYDEVVEAKKEAAKKLALETSKKEALTGEKSRLAPVVKQSEKEIAKWQALQDKIDEANSHRIQNEKIDDFVRREAEWYRETFGSDDFYVELQYHGFQTETEIMPRLAALSDELGIPSVLANDAHIPTSSGDDVLARSIIRTTRFLKDWEAPSASDYEMYLKTDEELKEWVGKIIPKAKVNEAFENIGRITSQCHVALPKEKHYPSFKTPDGSTPEEYLRRMAYEGIPKKYPNGFPDEKEGYERLEHELDVICSMGYADYHCIVEDFLRYARAAGKLDMSDPEQEKLALSFDIEAIERYTANLPGETVGPGRGSAAGSLVCYLVGITNIDPLKYGLLFERFLNPERVTMPDIDCDIETNIRPYVIRYVKHKYGEKSVAGIMTRGKQTGKAAIQTAGRAYGIQKNGDSTAFLGVVNTVSKKAVELSDDELHMNLKKIETELYQAFDSDKVAHEIIRYAILIEGCMTQIGQHAAGVIITDGKPVEDYVPLVYNRKNDIMMTQCDMTQAEEIGLLKMDFLGLNNLTVITETLREIFKTSGKLVDMDRISYDDPNVFSRIIAPGMTNSVFQLESNGMKQMLQQFGPDSIFDLILLVAMFRPGPLQFLPDVIAVKNGRKQVSYLTPELEPILKSTYGSITYQEQVQEIFRSLAGYSLGQADLVRRAMSKKKDSVLRAERSSFLNGDPERNIAGCVANNISVTAANELFDEMTDFAKYAFNKSHAACYAVVAYQTAWLKYYYPREYMKSVMNNTDFDKLPGLIRDLKTMGIGIKAPDINLSEQGFSLHDGNIVFGLGSIKGLGKSVDGVEQVRAKGGAFKSIQDFILRTDAGKTILTNFTDAGAFDSFCTNRAAITAMIPEYLTVMKKIKDQRKRLEKQYDPKKIASYEAKIKESKAKLKELVPDTDICEDGMERLKKERDRLSVFVSMNPMELYPEPEKCGAVPIIDALTAGRREKLSVTGMISDYRIRYRKADGAPMSFFTLGDCSGSINVCCFTKEFAAVGESLADDTVVRITGSIMVEDDGTKKLKLDGVSELHQRTKTILIFAKKSMFGGELQNMLKPHIAKKGYPCKIYDMMMGEFRNCDLRLSASVLNSKELYNICQKKPVMRDFG